MTKKNIDNLLNFLDEIDSKLFKDVKKLDHIDHKILKKFKSINKNLEEIEELVEFQTIIKKIADQMKLDTDHVLQRYYFYKKLKII
jgi:CRISPR/Cas system CSM-associated protein Csm4 (group 5 of RAMP superfamily)